MTMVHHTCLSTADMELALRFYRDGLGLSVLADFTLDADLDALLRRPTRKVRVVFLGDSDSPQAATLELLTIDEPDLPAESAQPGRAQRGLFLLSFQVDVPATLARLAELGLGGEPRTMRSPGGITASVVDPDGVVVELLSGPVSFLPGG